MRYLTLRICALSLLLAPAAHAQSRSTRFIAPTSENIVTSTDEGNGSNAAHVIWVRNLSTVQIIVTSISLSNCENLKDTCSPKRLNLRVPPSGRTVVLRAEPRNPDLAMTYRMSFSWRPDSTDATAVRLLAENGIPIGSAKVDAHEQELERVRAEARAIAEAQARDDGVEKVPSAAASSDRPVARLDDKLLLSDSLLASLGPQIARLRTEPDSIVLRVGQIYLVRRVRLLAIDAGGELLGRVSVYNWRVAKGPVSVQADTVTAQTPGRVMADFRLKPPLERLTTQLPIIVLGDSEKRPDTPHRQH